MSKPTSQVKDRYNKKAYDQILLRLPKGKKDLVKEKSESLGYKSVNEFIVAAVNAFEKNKEEESLL